MKTVQRVSKADFSKAISGRKARYYYIHSASIPEDVLRDIVEDIASVPKCDRPKPCQVRATRTPLKLERQREDGKYSTLDLRGKDTTTFMHFTPGTLFLIVSFGFSYAVYEVCE